MPGKKSIRARHGVVDNHQKECNDAIDLLFTLQRKDNLEGELPTPINFGHYLRTSVICQSIALNMPIKEDIMRQTCHWWWSYLQLKFDLPDSAHARILLEAKCIKPMVELGWVIKNPVEKKADPEEGRKKLANWLLQTYFTDTKDVVKPDAVGTLHETMSAFVDELEENGGVCGQHWVNCKATSHGEDASATTT
jgi:hypothetical protein